jgi:hypothetical protein
LKGSLGRELELLDRKKDGDIIVEVGKKVSLLIRDPLPSDIEIKQFVDICPQCYSF